MSDPVAGHSASFDDLARPRPLDGAQNDPPPARSALTAEQARLLPFYHDIRNEIVQPDKVYVSTQYFWREWAPRLGPTLTLLVVCLRRHCYFNRATQERRDWCFPEQATLAREVGVETTKTIRAALQHPLAVHFVRREARYVYDPARAKKVRTSDMYYVAMDDPLTPEDEVRLALRAAERLVSEGRGAENLEPAIAPTRPKSQKDRQITRRKADSPGGQKDLQVDRPTGHIARQDSAVNFSPEDVPVIDTKTTIREATDPILEVVAAFGAANGTTPTPAQSARLRALCEQFDRPARGARQPASGAEWVLAAIAEAVESGSNFVAPRRIARICERWAADGGPIDALPDEPASRKARAVGSRVTAVSHPLNEGYPEEDHAEIDSPLATPPRLPVEPPIAPSFVVFPELGLHSRPFWQTVCDEARRRITTSHDVNLLVGSQLLARDENVLTIGMPGRSIAERAELRLKGALRDITRSIVGRPVEFCFVGYGEWIEGGR